MKFFAISTEISPRQQWFNRLTWWLLFSVGMFDLFAVTVLGWQVDWHNASIILIVLSPLALLAGVFTWWRPEPRIVLVLNLTMQLILLVFATALLNYVTSPLDMPLRDSALIAADKVFFFHWHDYVLWVRQHPLVSSVLTFSYVSAWGRCMVALILLFLTGHFIQLQHFIFSVLAGAVICILVAALLPALGGYAFYAVDPAQLPGTDLPAAGTAHVGPLLALRSGAFHFVDFHFEGLITFPSYHTSFAVFLIYAFWPFTVLRLPVLVLNFLLMLSTPVDGGHYLVDILAGIVVANATLRLARRLLPPETEGDASPVEPGGMQ